MIRPRLVALFTVAACGPPPVADTEHLSLASHAFLTPDDAMDAGVCEPPPAGDLDALVEYFEENPLALEDVEPCFDGDRSHQCTAFPWWWFPLMDEWDVRIVGECCCIHDLVADALRSSGLSEQQKESLRLGSNEWFVDDCLDWADIGGVRGCMLRWGLDTWGYLTP